MRYGPRLISRARHDFRAAGTHFGAAGTDSVWKAPVSVSSTPVSAPEERIPLSLRHGFRLLCRRRVGDAGFRAAGIGFRAGDTGSGALDIDCFGTASTGFRAGATGSEASGIGFGAEDIQSGAEGSLEGVLRDSRGNFKGTSRDPYRDLRGILLRNPEGNLLR